MDVLAYRPNMIKSGRPWQTCTRCTICIPMGARYNPNRQPWGIMALWCRKHSLAGTISRSSVCHCIWLIGRASNGILMAVGWKQSRIGHWWNDFGYFFASYLIDGWMWVVHTLSVIARNCPLFFGIARQWLATTTLASQWQAYGCFTNTQFHCGYEASHIAKERAEFTRNII